MFIQQILTLLLPVYSWPCVSSVTIILAVSIRHFIPFSLSLPSHFHWVLKFQSMSFCSSSWTFCFQLASSWTSSSRFSWSYVLTWISLNASPLCLMLSSLPRWLSGVFWSQSLWTGAILLVLWANLTVLQVKSLSVHEVKLYRTGFL